MKMKTPVYISMTSDNKPEPGEKIQFTHKGLSGMGDNGADVWVVCEFKEYYPEQDAILIDITKLKGTSEKISDFFVTPCHIRFCHNVSDKEFIWQVVDNESTISIHSEAESLSCKLYQLYNEPLPPESVSMYSFDRPSRLFFTGVIKYLMEHGMSKEGIIWNLQSKNIRWMLDRYEDEVEELGKNMAEKYACFKFKIDESD